MKKNIEASAPPQFVHLSCAPVYDPTKMEENYYSVNFNTNYKHITSLESSLFYIHMSYLWVK